MSEICASLHKKLASLSRYAFPFHASMLPYNGIYVLFESGETGHGTDRIVRIGTHTGDGQLPSRLQQHFLDANKDRSIFRKNIGRALLTQKWRVPGLQSGNTPRKYLKNKGSCVCWKVAKPQLTQEPTHVAMHMRPPQRIRLSLSL
jgi:hypothetical protein